MALAYKPHTAAYYAPEESITDGTLDVVAQVVVSETSQALGGQLTPLEEPIMRGQLTALGYDPSDFHLFLADAPDELGFSIEFGGKITIGSRSFRVSNKPAIWDAVPLYRFQTMQLMEIY